MRKFLLIINCNTCIHIFQLFQSLDEIMSCDNIEEIVTTSHQQTEDIGAKLYRNLKCYVISSYLQNLSKSFT